MAEKIFTVDPTGTTGTPQSYTVKEYPRDFYTLNNIKCFDNTGDTVVDLANKTANIKVSAGETVACTFFNRWASYLNGKLP